MNKQKIDYSIYGVNFIMELDLWRCVGVFLTSHLLLFYFGGKNRVGIEMS